MRRNNSRHGAGDSGQTVNIPTHDQYSINGGESRQVSPSHLSTLGTTKTHENPVLHDLHRSLRIPRSHAPSRRSGAQPSLDRAVHKVARDGQQIDTGLVFDRGVKKFRGLGRLGRI